MKKQILALLLAANVLVGVSGCAKTMDTQSEQMPTDSSVTVSSIPQREEPKNSIPHEIEAPTIPSTEAAHTEPAVTEKSTVPTAVETEAPTERATEPEITEAPTESVSELPAFTEPEVTETYTEIPAVTEPAPTNPPAATEPEPTEVPETTQPVNSLDYAAAMAYGNAYAQNTYGALPGPDLNFYNAGYDPFARYRIEWIIEQGGQDYLNSQVAQNVDALYESLESSGGFAGAAINCDVHEAKYDHEEAGKVYIYIYYG